MVHLNVKVPKGKYKTILETAKRYPKDNGEPNISKGILHWIPETKTFEKIEEKNAD